MENNRAPRLEAVDAALRKAIEEARKGGLKIRQGTWGVQRSNEDEEGKRFYVAQNNIGEPNCLCPMSCLLIGTESKTGDVYSPEDDAAALLGISSDEVTNFVVGFDEAEMDVDHVQDEYYFLGRGYRKQVDA